jgi:hypothetical protein
VTITLSYDAQLSRVRVTGTALPAGTVTATAERSSDGIRWATVRGALRAPVTAGLELERPADDYEFTADTLNTYRLTSYDVAGVQLGQESATVTPDLGGVPWLKVIARPYLNRPVVVSDYSDVERGERAGVHEIVAVLCPWS